MTVDQPLEGPLAWDLVDQIRDKLTDEERHIAFVHLGVGDYLPVFRCVLETVARQRISLPSSTILLLHAWIDVYDRNREFEDVLLRAVGSSDLHAGPSRHGGATMDP